MNTVRFFHIRPNLLNGGATVRVSNEGLGFGKVAVQVALCHSSTKSKKGDPYCKKTGRAISATAPARVVPLRYLPRELDRVYREAYHRGFGHEMSPYNPGPDYSFSVKYFLPKE